jgi:predicted Rossmann-fold nucleotide-binding protein
MRFCFIGSGTDRERAPLGGIEIAAVAELMREHYNTMVFGGSAIGVMGDFARAFLASGGNVVSVLLHAEALPHGSTKEIRCRSLAARKKELFRSVDAVLCYPGGLGTLDELFDFFARRTTEEIAVPVRTFLYNWHDYYSPLLLQLERGGHAGLIGSESMPRIEIFESADSLRSLLETPDQPLTAPTSRPLAANDIKGRS